MPHTFSQSRAFLTTYKFTLEEKGLAVHESSVLTRKRFTVPFETIPNDSVEVTTYSQSALVLLVIMGTIGCFQFTGGYGASFLLSGVPVAIWFWISRVTYLVLNCGEHSVVLYKRYPSEESVRDFLEMLQSHKRNYLKKNYAETRTGTIADELQKLTWLKENGTLTEEEFERLKASLLDEITKPKGRLGFTDSQAAT